MIRPATETRSLAALWNPLITDTVATFAATPTTPADLHSLIVCGCSNSSPDTARAMG